MNPEPDVEQATMILNLSIGSMRQTAHVKKEKVRTMEDAIREIDREWDEADDQVLRVSKELFDNKKVVALAQLLTSTRSILRGGALPVRFLRRGLYLYSIARMPWAEAKIAEAQSEIDERINELEAEWPAILEAERKRLEPLGLYDASDYPSIERIRDTARIRFGWLRFTAPTGDLRGVPQDLLEREREKTAKLWGDLTEQIRDAQRQMLQDFVDGLLATLKPGEDGKTKVLRQARLEKTIEFLTTYRPQDVTRDEEAAALADRARELLRGVDVEVLRTEPRAASRIEAGLGAIKSEIDALVISGARRVVLK